jgi:galactose mutarotase-like enzyme
MTTIENELLKVTIDPKGAELTSLTNKSVGLDYMWSGDPAFWAKHSPILFPIVGTLKQNTYHYNGKLYKLPRHGFARDLQFAVDNQAADSVTFVLYDDEDTRKVFPFPFAFRICYTLYKNSLAVSYEVINTGKEELFFSLGAHPAFKLPLVKGTQYNDYYLEFDQPETAPRWPISPDGLIEKTPSPLLQNSRRIPLTKDLFQRDALVLKNLRSTIVELKSDKTPHSLRMDFPGFPYMGIWAAKNADFICLEPWCGIADSVDADQQLEHKEGINRLVPEEKFTRMWTVTLS